MTHLVKHNKTRFNLAYSLDSLATGIQTSLSLIDAANLASRRHADKCAIIWHEDGDIFGIALSRRRSMLTTWDLKHLWIDPDKVSDPGKLLSLLCQLTANHGCDRIFVRLRRDDQAVDSIKNAGFTYCKEEFLYRFSGRKSEWNDFESGVRPRIPTDDYNLFRLYNSSTPISIRTTVGMTFDQWRGSIEQSKSSTEFVSEVDGQMAGWLRTIGSKKSSIFEMTIHPEHKGVSKTLLEFALKHLQSVPSISCLVPNYQPAFQSLLTENGFVLDKKFITLVRPIAAPERILDTHHALTAASP